MAPEGSRKCRTKVWHKVDFIQLARAGVQFDYVVTVCRYADENCPVFLVKTEVVHVGFEDPPKLTKHLPDGEEKLAVYRRVRDGIRRFVEGLPAKC
jgi:arsenate reductase